MAGSPGAWANDLRGFHRGLKETRASVEGESFVIVYRWAEGQRYRTPALAADDSFGVEFP